MLLTIGNSLVADFELIFLVNDYQQVAMQVASCWQHIRDPETPLQLKTSTKVN